MATAIQERFPDHGDEGTWVKLDSEQTRCLLGLKNYYMVCEDKSAETALELAWIDLKKEQNGKTGVLIYPELKTATWFISGDV